MTVLEAKMILGLEPTEKMSKETLQKLHRRAMLMNHPDKGGSAYLALKINQARDILNKHV